MSPRRPLGRKLIKAILPVALLLMLGVIGVVVWIVNGASHPPQRPYLVTPEQFRHLSDRGLKATDERWLNRDGTEARGWLLRGAPGAPAVVLLHRFGADRSWLFNLGVKISETTNFTVLWPDLRAHGQNPSIAATSFGGREAEDGAAALDFVRALKTPQGETLVNSQVGFYGVEMGAYAALIAATRDSRVRALALDSVPASPNDVLDAAVKAHTGIDSSLLQLLARGGMRLYSLGNYETTPACEAASSLTNRRVLLLSGEEAGRLRDSTAALAKCFPPQAGIEIYTDLPLTGVNLSSATGAQGEAYDRRVIDFFNRALSPTP